MTPSKEASPAKRATYHHGRLREALIEAADSIIRERGLEGFSLREATRRAGVSPGAPKHHFGDTRGLLTEVAIKAFHDQAEYMQAVPATDSIAVDLRASVTAYIRFALASPSHYRLMFRTHLLERGERLLAAQKKSLERMALLMAAYDGVQLADETGTILAPSVIGSLATAHGLAHYALDETSGAPSDGTSDMLLLGSTLRQIIERRWPDL